MTEPKAIQPIDEDSAESALLAPAPAGHPGPRFPLAGCELTDQEQVVWWLLAQGVDNLRISERLSISVLEARTLVHQVVHKLGVAGREEAILLARHHGLVPATGQQAQPSSFPGSGPGRKEGQGVEPSTEPEAPRPGPYALEREKENG